MTARLIVVLSVAMMCQAMIPALAQSKISGAPSNAPPRVTDVTKKADTKGDEIQTVFDNIEMWTSYLRQQQIESGLGGYLNQIGAKPTSSEVHMFYVQALINKNGSVDLKDFQYLTSGKTVEDALRESFTVENSPGTEDRLDATPNGTNLVGIYVTATAEDGKFVIRGGPLSKEFYQKMRREGLALRDQRAMERAEKQRIDKVRQEQAGVHKAGDLSAHDQLRKAREMGPPRPSQSLSAPVYMGDRPAVYSPPTRTGQVTKPVFNPEVDQPRAHPPVQFNQPVPAQTPTPGAAINDPS